MLSEYVMLLSHWLFGDCNISKNMNKMVPQPSYHHIYIILAIAEVYNFFKLSAVRQELCPEAALHNLAYIH